MNNATNQPLKWPTKDRVALENRNHAAQCALENFDQSAARMASSTQIPACLSMRAAWPGVIWKSCPVSIAKECDLNLLNPGILLMFLTRKTFIVAQNKRVLRTLNP